MPARFAFDSAVGRTSRKDSEWMEDAACHDRTELFFREVYFSTTSEKYIKTLAEIRSICARCPVFETCLAYGVDNFEYIRYGWMAGYHEHDRATAFLDAVPLKDWRQSDGRFFHEPKFLTATGRKMLRRREAEREIERRQQNGLPVKHNKAVLRRPDCPNEHGPEWTIQRGSYADGSPKWWCYRCEPGHRAFREEEYAVG